VCNVSFIVCVAFCAVFCLSMMCDMCICVLCLIVIPLPNDENLFAVQINNINNNNNNIVTLNSALPPWKMLVSMFLLAVLRTS
jgi:hypothetical protein